MRDLAAEGLGILFVTSDLDEVLALSDRILVMANGRITGEFPAGTDAATVIAAATPSLQRRITPHDRHPPHQPSANWLLLLLRLRTFVALILVLGLSSRSPRRTS